MWPMCAGWYFKCTPAHTRTHAHSLNNFQLIWLEYAKKNIKRKLSRNDTSRRRRRASAALDERCIVVAWYPGVNTHKHTHTQSDTHAHRHYTRIVTPILADRICTSAFVTASRALWRKCCGKCIYMNATPPTTTILLSRVCVRVCLANYNEYSYD